ncbi:MAG: hypothetical protein CMC35_01910 [Flavobacteriaceae bacterium]|nr:hypothetical protein [Flavobacteriaceae bacterium]
MNRLTYISIHVILPAFLAAALLFPTSIQFSHLFADHEHKECGDVSTHLHEQKVHCDIDLFHFSQFYDGLAATFNSLTPATHVTNYFQYTLQHDLENTHSIYLRGPPEVVI